MFTASETAGYAMARVRTERQGANHKEKAKDRPVSHPESGSLEGVVYALRRARGENDLLRLQLQ